MMDSDDSFDDILPEARIFETRVDDIWNETMAAYEELYKEKEIEVNQTPRDAQDVCSNKSRRGAKSRKKCLVKGDKVKKDVGISEENFEKLLTENSKCLSASARKRIKKVELKVEEESKRVARETEQTLMSFERSKKVIEKEVDLLEDVEPDKDIALKFRYKSEIHRLTVGPRETFSSIFKKVADSWELKPSEILLCFGDANIKLDDTPNSLKLKIFHIIDCYPYKPDEKDKNNLLIKIQSNDTRKRTELYIHKLDKFEEIMKEYAQLRSMDLQNLVFEFDGEKINESETPSDFDMESGSCIDVNVLNFKPGVLNKGSKE